MMTIIKEFLTTYWSQVTLLLFGIGYFVQLIFNLRTKKLEINHSLFQQKRLEAINDFFMNYAKAEQMWMHLSIYDILNNRLNAKEIDEVIFPPLNELGKNVLQLQIFFNENEHTFFNEILKNLESINSTLMTVYFDFDADSGTVLKTNAFTSKRNEMLQKNALLLKEISSLLRKTFK